MGEQRRSRDESDTAMASTHSGGSDAHSGRSTPVGGSEAAKMQPSPTNRSWQECLDEDCRLARLGEEERPLPPLPGCTSGLRSGSYTMRDALA